jgi:carbonic anhydrase
LKVIEITYRYDGTDATVRPSPIDADAARARLEDGSRSMSALLDDLTDGSGTAKRVITVDPRDLGLALSAQGLPRQRPYAAILGCSDARVPIELIFKEGPNDLFVVRVAGNGLGSEVLGSLKYAIDHLGGSLKLIVVLGHSGCGAVSAAVDAFLDPRSYLSIASQHSLRGILDRLLVVVNTAAMRMIAIFGPEVAGRPGYRAALIEVAVITNAALAAYTLQQEISGADSNGIRAAYGVYLIGSRQVWAPRAGSDECAGLAYPPADFAAFEEFGTAVLRTDRIERLLSGNVA